PAILCQIRQGSKNIVRSCSPVALSDVSGFPLRYDSWEDVGLQDDEDADEASEDEAMEEDIAQDVAFATFLARGYASHDDGLSVNHLAHDATAGIRGCGENGREVELLGRDFLQAAKEHVG